jgi:hypothetical protein
MNKVERPGQPDVLLPELNIEGCCVQISITVPKNYIFYYSMWVFIFIYLYEL